VNRVERFVKESAHHRAHDLSTHARVWRQINKPLLELSQHCLRAVNCKNKPGTDWLNRTMQSQVWLADNNAGRVESLCLSDTPQRIAISAASLTTEEAANHRLRNLPSPGCLSLRAVLFHQITQMDGFGWLIDPRIRLSRWHNLS
jgi:hypothetical protein